MSSIYLQLAVGGSVILISILSVLCNTFFVKKSILKKDRDVKSDENIKQDLHHRKISVVITVNDEAEELSKSLPLWLTQEYSDYEVIVVVDKRNTESEDIIKRLDSHDHLYTTYIPQTSRYMSRKKLSITLGVKASHNEWIVLTEPSVEPPSRTWLAYFSSYLDDKHTAILGMTQYDDDASDFKHFEQLHTTLRIIKDTRNGKAARTNMPLIAIRKSIFLSQHGFRGNQKYLRGEYDFLINKYGSRSLVVDAPELICKQYNPTPKMWRNLHIFYQETRKHLNGLFAYKWKYRLEQLLLHLSIVASVVTIAVAISRNFYLLLGMAIVALMSIVALRTMTTRRTLNRFGLNIPYWKLPFYDISLVWRDLLWRIRYLKADSYDFISHKI